MLLNIVYKTLSDLENTQRASDWGTALFHAPVQWQMIRQLRKAGMFLDPWSFLSAQQLSESPICKTTCLPYYLLSVTVELGSRR